jgi:hypothetical protein
MGAGRLLLNIQFSFYDPAFARAYVRMEALASVGRRHWRRSTAFEIMGVLIHAAVNRGR